MLADQGGIEDPDAVEGFKNIIWRCTRMGHPFLSVDPWSGRTEFLVFERGIDESFEKAWQIFQDQESTKTRQLMGKTMGGSKGLQEIWQCRSK